MRTFLEVTNSMIGGAMEYRMLVECWLIEIQDVSTYSKRNACGAG